MRGDVAQVQRVGEDGRGRGRGREFAPAGRVRGGCRPGVGGVVAVAAADALAGGRRGVGGAPAPADEGEVAAPAGEHGGFPQVLVVGEGAAYPAAARQGGERGRTRAVVVVAAAQHAKDEVVGKARQRAEALRARTRRGCRVFRREEVLVALGQHALRVGPHRRRRPLRCAEGCPRLRRHRDARSPREGR